MPEVLIIGAGPAGLAAALQLKRRGVDFILFERQQVGDQCRRTVDAVVLRQEHGAEAADEFPCALEDVEFHALDVDLDDIQPYESGAGAVQADQRDRGGAGAGSVVEQADGAEVALLAGIDDGHLDGYLRVVGVA